GRNDVLYVRGNGLALLEFKVFNRYGKLVYETGDYNLEEGWDGTINDVKSEMEVYTYYLKAICEDGGLIEQKGNITLIR
ncbi:MAG: gliding motility-associated C-terminal domain-containing protein, partial [Bacteroidales bacterium]|nr:gliding motility-associated C-terminal domain-containing protein [Bacteroidales bacterium]